jgi:hypothetical protein
MNTISMLLTLSILTLAGVDSKQQVTTELRVLADPVLSLNHTYLATTESDPSTQTSIRLGDALSLRMILRNDSEEPSEEVDATLGSRSRPPVIVVHPDGSETIVPIYSSAFTIPPRARPMEPGEEVTIDIFVYKVTMYDESGRQIGFDYVFPKPGVYQLYFKHQPEDARTAIEKKRRGEPLRPPLVSNRVTVRVDPPIAGWPCARRRGIGSTHFLTDCDFFFSRLALSKTKFLRIDDGVRRSPARARRVFSRVHMKARSGGIVSCAASATIIGETLSPCAGCARTTNPSPENLRAPACRSRPSCARGRHVPAISGLIDSASRMRVRARANPSIKNLRAQASSSSRNRPVLDLPSCAQYEQNADHSRRAGDDGVHGPREDAPRPDDVSRAECDEHRAADTRPSPRDQKREEDDRMWNEVGKERADRLPEARGFAEDIECEQAEEGKVGEGQDARRPAEYGAGSGIHGFLLERAVGRRSQRADEAGSLAAAYWLVYTNNFRPSSGPSKKGVGRRIGGPRRSAGTLFGLQSPAVILHLHIVPAAGRRDDLLAFLRRARPYYESPGGIRMRLLESQDGPDALIEVVEYDTVSDYEEDDERVKNDVQTKELLEEWRSLLAGPPRVEVYRTVDL